MTAIAKLDQTKGNTRQERTDLMSHGVHYHGKLLRSAYLRTRRYGVKAHYVTESLEKLDLTCYLLLEIYPLSDLKLAGDIKCPSST